MFKAYYKGFKSPANIYSIDKFRDTLAPNNPQCWLLVTMKELYTLRGNSNDEVVCEIVRDPKSQQGLDYVSCKTFNLRSKPGGNVTGETSEKEQYIWVIA